jgi:hypothetical protein
LRLRATVEADLMSGRARPSLPSEYQQKHHDCQPLPRGAMDRRLRELVLLALLSAFLCAIALMYEQPLAAAVFAALTCAIGVIAVLLRRDS